MRCAVRHANNEHSYGSWKNGKRRPATWILPRRTTPVELAAIVYVVVPEPVPEPGERVIHATSVTASHEQPTFVVTETLALVPPEGILLAIGSETVKMQTRLANASAFSQDPASK